MFDGTLCHAEIVSGARFVSSSLKGNTTPASTLDVRRTLVRVFADDTKQTGGHNSSASSVLLCKNVLWDALRGLFIVRK